MRTRIDLSVPPCDVWGSGHTAATDPTRQGWRCRPRETGVLILGQRGVAGCASIARLSAQRLDVALYSDVTPEALSAAWHGGEKIYADSYHSVEDYPGWGLAVIQLVERARQD